MFRRNRSPYLSCLALLSLVLLQPRNVQAQAPSHQLRCTSVIVGRSASADGSVLLGHNEDLDGRSAQHYLAVPRLPHAPDEVFTLWGGSKVPQPAETYGYIATTVFDIDYLPGDLTSGINEHQVSVANNYAPQRAPDTSEPTEGRILWSELTRMALERAATSREAVELLGELVQTYRLSVDEGTMFAIADPAEGWWIEIAQEGQWVAQRVPDDGAVMRANAYRIGPVDCDDPATFLCSDDLVSYAQDQGWYDPARDGAFNFAQVYGAPEDAVANWNVHREERLQSRLAEMIPQVTPRDIMSLLRDHFEGTEYDLTDGYSLGSPHETDEYGVCGMTTEISVVCQSRGWLPSEIGGLCWRAMGPPCSSVFVPWYQGGSATPEAYRLGTSRPTPGSAWWAFRELAEAVNERYDETIGDLRAHWEAIEEDETTDLAPLEEEALEQYATDPDEARNLLSVASHERALLAYTQAATLVENGLDVDALSTPGDGDADADSDADSEDLPDGDQGDGGPDEDVPAASSSCSCRAAGARALVPAIWR
jgi:dipeptidase